MENLLQSIQSAVLFREINRTCHNFCPVYLIFLTLSLFCSLSAIQMAFGRDKQTDKRTNGQADTRTEALAGTRVRQ